MPVFSGQLVANAISLIHLFKLKAACHFISSGSIIHTLVSLLVSLFQSRSNLTASVRDMGPTCSGMASQRERRVGWITFIVTSYVGLRGVTSGSLGSYWSFITLLGTSYGQTLPMRVH